MADSLGFRLYLTATGLLTAYADRELARRLEMGKEVPERIGERRGETQASRPEGRLIWFHAASVGESVSLLTLIDQLLDAHPDLSILVTTVTRTSAALMAERLPPRTIHQFAPVDSRPYIRRFLTHWRPDIAIWTESELWPALIYETDQSGCPMFLLNARMSPSSRKKWRWLRGIARSMLERFDYILAQDRRSADYLLSLGAPKATLRVVGSLKQSSEALPHNEAERDDIADELEGRPVWLAASTHPGEEKAAADAHRQVRRSSTQLLLIIAPRHPERGPEIAEALRADGWKVGLRSEGDGPSSDIEIYVADTLGELGIWYRISPITFLGGSLAEIGGHNAFEPATLGSAIIHGPHVFNASELYARLADANAAREVANGAELAAAVQDMLQPHVAAEMAHAAWEVSSAGAEASDAALTLLSEALDEIEAAP